MELTEERERGIVEAYNRGDKTLLIQMNFGIGPGELYRALHRAKVSFRSLDANHPASSLKVRRQIKDETSMEAPFVKKLIQLSHTEVSFFRQIWEDKAKEYEQPMDFDTYMEAYVEFFGILVDRLQVWAIALGNESVAALGLVAFKEAIEAIKQLEPEE